ncbi:hypothetical protein JS562_04510 [Agrobacterium sp. S2]|nr:hypothetical protein [Agrobacterium sp. S2]
MAASRLHSGHPTDAYDLPKVDIAYSVAEHQPNTSVYMVETCSAGQARPIALYSAMATRAPADSLRTEELRVSSSYVSLDILLTKR